MSKQARKSSYVPNFLIPKVAKKAALLIFSQRENEWRLYAEGCLRNRRFHEAIFERGHHCLVCDKPIAGKNGQKVTQCDKHHNDYIRLCVGWVLEEGHDDELRAAEGREFNQVPNCRECELQNPEYFQECVKRVFPVHHQCHSKIHEVEKRLIAGKKAWLKRSFRACA